ncbi:hypothetical protein [Yoonia sp. BS5-3]|uniref:Response regulatory domain-containing protein n=1 Tax=Yoonia phaeophyticola TaxID=3137369 RepID=A0ABZ2V985_9RHOB
MLTDSALQEVLNCVKDRLLFAYSDDGANCIANKIAHAFVPAGMDIADWLSGPYFHDAANRTRLPARATPKAVLLGEKFDSVTVGYLSPAGAEHIFEFDLRQMPENNCWLITGHDVTLQPSTALDPTATHVEKVAHDLGNVLGIAQIAADGLGRSGLGDDARMRVADILNAVHRGNYLVQSLIDPDQASDRQVEHTADVPSVIQNAAELFQRVLPPAITLSVDPVPQIRTTAGSHSELEATVIEMLGAARKFIVLSPSKAGRISVQTTQRTDTVKIRVLARIDASDAMQAASYAMPPDLIRTLVASAELAKAAGGGLSVGSADDHEQRISLRLPVLPASLDNYAPSGHQPPSDMLRGYRICLAQSDGTLARSLARYLRAQGADIIEISEGDAFPDVIKAIRDVDVVIASQTLPDTTPVRDLVRAMPSAAPHVRMIHFSTVATYPKTAEGNVFGLCLPKSVPLETLLNAIRLLPPRADLGTDGG